MMTEVTCPLCGNSSPRLVRSPQGDLDVCWDCLCRRFDEAETRKDQSCIDCGKLLFVVCYMLTASGQPPVVKICHEHLMERSGGDMEARYPA